MKHYYQTIKDDFCEDDILVCELTTFDVDIAKEEYRHYMNGNGEFFKRDIYKNPCLKNFFKLYFGIEDGGFYITPSMYILPDEKSAKEFFNIAKELKYHDKYNQTFCEVKQNGNFVDVYYGDY